MLARSNLFKRVPTTVAVAVAVVVGLMSLGLVLGLSDSAFAQAAAKSKKLGADGLYIMNTLLFLMGGFLVMWMAAGFAMLEAGMVRTKNVAMQCTKNISLYSIAGLMYWVVGYNLMYPGDGNWLTADVIGAFAPKTIPDPKADPGTYAVASD